MTAAANAPRALGRLYEHSGKAPLGGLLIGILGGGFAGLILAFVYAYSTAYIPIVGYVTFLLSLGYGAALGGLTAWLLKKGKVRNTTLTILLTLGITTFSFWLHWVAWLYAMYGRADADVPFLALLFPPIFLEALLQVNEHGAWSMSGGTPTGWMLWILWTIEALMIYGASLFVAFALMSDGVFCEGCQSWLEGRTLALILGRADEQSLTRRLSEGDVGVLDRASPPDPQDQSWHEVMGQGCPSCGHTNAITLERVTRKPTDKDPHAVARDMLIDRLLVSAEELREVRELGSAMLTGLTAAGTVDVDPALLAQGGEQGDEQGEGRDPGA